MAVRLATMNSVHPTPPSSATNVSPRPLGLRPSLPDRSVTGDSIEDSYVNFILYCNPAVPLDTDTTALREAFRVPPKSDGKVFSTFTLFQLIKQLDSKELKTWAELALKLGVTPPDQEKGQSSQKIQQYAVRLKRWMHSMHVDAFFDYILDNERTYWTQIPTDPNPVCEEGRDGVAAEDDMALRSLLPQIKPRRGRRKPEDDLNKSPSQRPRLESPNLAGDGTPARPDVAGPWTAHPDGQRAFLFPPSEQPRSAFPWPSELGQTPLSAYPQSAMTPINGPGFWGDPSEPRSAITPSKAKQLGRRHGAKVVSSAWRSGGSGGNGKTRGRPPLNRTVDSPLSAVPEPNKVFQTPAAEKSASPSAPSITTPVPAVSGSPSVTTPTSATIPSSRPPRPGRLSLQVPERAGGNVRLATPPPPLVMLNGESAIHTDDSNRTTTSAPPTLAPSSSSFTMPPTPTTNGKGRSPHNHAPSGQDDMTNVQEVESLFISELLVAHWTDAEGNTIAPCGFDEAVAIAQTIIGNMQKQALTPESFLLNLTALAGGSILQRGVRVCVTRLEEGPTHNRYGCKWALRYGALTGNFSLTETVPHSEWKGKQEQEHQGDRRRESDTSTDMSEMDVDVQHWKKKYQGLLRVVRADHEQTTHLKVKVLESLKNHPAASELAG